MTLSIQRVDDVVEAHEITDEWQVLAVARLIRVRECSRHDAAKLPDIAHANATHGGIERQRPAQGPVGLRLRTQQAHQVLVEEVRSRTCDWQTRLLDDRIDLRFAGKAGQVDPAAADCFDIRQRRPDKVLSPRPPSQRRCRGCLLALVGAGVPEIGDQEDAVRTL